MTDWKGKQLAKYQIKELLGRGGMGQVYRAFHPALERDVAIKMIYPHLADTPDFVNRFQREARTIAALRHPGIVQVHDFDVEGDTFYMVMEFVEGENLGQRLADLQEQGDWMLLPEALRLFQLITQAVAYAHDRGVIHRDLKPANVLLTSERQPILVDFGLSKIIGGKRLTASGTVLGTPTYMAPEQCEGEPGDERTDIYALGVILYELATGTLPFDDDTPVGVILKHITQRPAPPRSINPDLPAEVEEVIQTALAKAPADRFQSAQEMLEAIEAAVALPLLSFAPTLLEAEADTRCPYRGLQVFEEEHAQFFFGREALVSQMVEALGSLFASGEKSRFLAVLGASGSGKSSLVRAGLIPRLRQGAIPESTQWAIHLMKPGTRPIEALSAELSSILISEGDGPEETRRLSERLAADGRALHRAVQLAWQEASPETRLFLVIDQFEEIFTLCHDENQRRRFIENLLFATAVGGGRVAVLLTMRADFYHRCAAYRDLASRLSAQQMLVGPMNEAELRRAIERPALQVGLRFEPGLVDTILADVSQQPGALPLLQHALLELWEWRHAGLLTLRAYQASGRVQGAIAQRAETIYASFDPEEQAMVRRVMLRLTQPGEGTEDTRRRVRKSELMPAPESLKAESQSRSMEKVIQQLADARLVTTTRDMVTGEEQVDVVHEALIRGWARLRGWLDEDRAALRTHRRLTEAANEWERNGRDGSYLYRGARLAEAEEFASAYAADTNPLEREFLTASVGLRDREAQEAERHRQRELAQARLLAEEQRQRAEEQTRTAAQLRRRALWLGGALVLLGGALILVLIAAIAAVYFGRQASDNAKLAQTEAAHAQSAEGTAQAEATRAIAAESTAVAEADRAISAESTAQAEANRATNAESTAVAEADRAESQQLEAERQGRIALSRQLAAQALTHMDDRLDLALLLSLEANRLADTPEVRGSLLAGLESSSPHLTAILRGHTDNVASVAFSPDSKVLASGGYDRIVILWDVETRQPLEEPLAVPRAPVSSVAFGPDGKILASSSIDGWITLWDAETHQPLDEIMPELGQPVPDIMLVVKGMAYSPDGRTLATGSCGETTPDATCTRGAIRIWDVGTRQPLYQPLSGHTGDVNSVAFSPDGQTLASGSGDGEIILWDVATGQAIGQPLSGHTDSVNSVAFSPDGKTLASGGRDEKVILWDVATGQPIGQPFTSHTASVSSVAFSPNGQTLVSSSGSSIILWDVGTGQPLGPPLIGHLADVNSVAFSPDGQMLASGDGNKTVILWDVAAHQSLGRPLTDRAFVHSLAFSPDGQTIASNGSDNAVVLWDVDTGQAIDPPLAGHTEDVWSVAFSPDGKTLASGSADQTVILWNVATGQAIGQPLVGHSQRVRTVIFSPDGRTLASSGEDDTIILWNVATGQAIGSPLSGHSTWSVAFSPDGKTLASVGHEIVFWDVDGHQALGDPLTGHDSVVSSVAFSPDGKTLATGSLDHTIILWDAATHQPISQPLVGHTDSVGGLAFSPDGRTLASHGNDRTIILWDAATGQPLGQPLIGHSYGVQSVAFSPDGKTLASGGPGDGILLWDVSLESWQARACRIANRNLTRQEWRYYVGDEEYRLTCPDLPGPEG